MVISLESVVDYYNYIVVVVLMMMGLWAMVSKNNLIKKCIGMAIFQTGIILFYISMGAKKGSTIPILPSGGHGHDAVHHIVASQFANPLTQILMLTAIVVGVATVGVALTVVQRIYQEYDSLNEDEIIKKVLK